MRQCVPVITKLNGVEDVFAHTSRKLSSTVIEEPDCLKLTFSL